MNAYAEIRARAEALDTLGSGTPEFAADPVIGQAADDLLTLLDEVERLRSALDNSAVGHGIAVAHAGDWKRRAETAEAERARVENLALEAVAEVEAERDRLRAAVDAVRALAERWDDRFLGAVRSTLPKHEWPNAGIDPRSRELRAALDEHLGED